MVEKNWPQATKNSVEKVAKRVTELEAKAKNLALNVRDIDNRLDTISASAAASALVKAVWDVAKAIREGGGGGGEAELAALRQQVGDALDKIASLTKANTAALEAPMAKRKPKKSQENTSASTGKEGTIMAVTQAELQTKLDEALKAVTDARPGVDSTVALIVAQREQIADLIANAPDLATAAASVDALMAEYQAQKQELADAQVAAGTP
jgi:chromosome segregation ATPase